MTIKPLKLCKSVFTHDIKNAKLLNTRLPPLYLSEVAAVGFDPQYLLNLNQKAYTLAHCATAHSSPNMLAAKSFTLQIVS